MRLSLSSFTLVAALLIPGSQALTAPTIAECPALKPRSAAATNVADLRPDDIKVVAALGDRYTIFNVIYHYHVTNIWFVVSWQALLLKESKAVQSLISRVYTSIVGLVTEVAPARARLLYLTSSKNTALMLKVVLSINILQRFAMALFAHLSNVGAKSKRNTQSLKPYLISCTIYIDRPSKDKLNAAQSAAMAPNLDHELDYLISGTDDLLVYTNAIYRTHIT